MPKGLNKKNYKKGNSNSFSFASSLIFKILFFSLRMYDLRTSLGTKKLVALESVSAFTAAYLGGSLCSLSFPLGVTIAGPLIILLYFFSSFCFGQYSSIQ